MNRGILAGLAAITVLGLGVGVYVVASPGGEEEFVQQAETPTPIVDASPVVEATPTTPSGSTLWRWWNVTLVIPEGSPIEFSAQDVSAELIPPSGGPAVALIVDSTPGDSKLSGLLIDAKTGSMLKDEVLDEDRDAMDAVLKTLEVSPLDPATAPWPYTGDPPSLKSDRVGNIEFITPEPASGIQIYFGVSDYIGPSVPDAPREYLRITNGRSTAIVSVENGARAYKNENVVESDLAAFERYIASLKVCGKEMEC